VSVLIDFRHLDESLSSVEKTLPRGKYVLTLIARFIGTDSLNADIILTRDDLPLVLEILKKRMNDDPVFRVGDLIP